MSQLLPYVSAELDCVADHLSPLVQALGEQLSQVTVSPPSILDLASLIAPRPTYELHPPHLQLTPVLLG